MKVSLFKSGSVAAGPNSPRPKPGESIRGKISGPIPIPDDEFPMRNPGTGIATTSPEELERQWQPEQQSTSSQREIQPSRNADSVSGPSASPQAPSTMPRSSPQSQRRTNPSGTMRHSTLSEATEQSGASNDKPQRKKSTLRGAFSKLFGRRKKNESTSTAGNRASTLQRPSQHQSDPSALTREHPKDNDSKRSASLPITEYDRALRSHSVGPNDMVAIESVRNSMHGDFSLSSRRRAATATSHLFRHKNGEFGGLSPRPASSHNLQASRSEEDPNEIGRAITSDIIGHKRRSRSLSGLEDSDGHHTTRRRSDEIRYWRESYDPGFMSPISSNPADIDQDDTGPVSMDLPRPAESHQDVPKTPLQPFDFGDMSQTHLKEMAGMKITQAASLESRVGSLEERMRRLEQRHGHLVNANVEYQTPHEQPTRQPPPVPSHGGRGVASSQYSGSLHSRESQLSMVDAQAYSGTTQLSAPSSKNRPTSGATIKDLAGVPPMSQTANGPFTSEHYATLLALLEMERGARLTLEAQVRRLTQRLDAMSSNSAPQVRPSVQLEPPPTARSFGNVSAFDHDDSDDEHHHGVKNRGMAPEDSGIATGSTTGGDDDEFSETFATPREENAYPYDGIGDELTDDEEEKRKKAARTLSLSQLTLGKSHPKAVI